MELKKQRFEEAIELCQQRFDSVVDNGTDEELFLSSYLCGHFDLIVGQAFLQQNYSLEDVNIKVLESVNAASGDDNLSEDELDQIIELWSQLYRNACI